MKNQDFQDVILNAKLTELSNEQLIDVNAGFIPVIIAAAEIYGGICLLAYGAGALHGLIGKL